MVNARQVDFADELDGGWLIGILVAAVHLEGVDSVLVDALKKHLSVLLRPKECANVREEDPVLCRSSWTSTGHLPPRGRRNMPLMLVYQLYVLSSPLNNLSYQLQDPSRLSLIPPEA